MWGCRSQRPNLCDHGQPGRIKPLPKITDNRLLNLRLEPLGALPARYEVFHVETEAHEILLAEGAAAESFIDYASGRHYDDYAACLDRHGQEPVIPEMPLPRVSAARLLPPALKARLGLGARPELQPLPRSASLAARLTGDRRSGAGRASG